MIGRDRAWTGSFIREVRRDPLVQLLSPREHTRLVLTMSALGLLLWGALTWQVGMPVWGATTMVLGLLLVPGGLKWRADMRQHGVTIMILSVILTMQGFHSVEHLAQWIQYHVLHWQPQRSSGLISAANAEWVHFIWNWGVVGIFALLILRGVRNRWAWLLLGWSVAHTMEHTYMLVRYLQLKQELGLLGVPQISAQGLPGILGRDGLLSTNPTLMQICGRVPGITTISRIDVHFWWNTGETLLLAATAHRFLRGHLTRQ